MNSNPNVEQSDPHFMHTFWMYTGAFLFSIVLLVLVHELGHYFAFRWRGYDMVSIRITPFFGMTTSSQEIQTGDAVIIILSGTVFSLTVASFLVILLRKTKTPYLIPFKMYPVVAFLVEGIVILSGLLFDETITDFAILIELGWSPGWVGFLGFVFILIGGYLSYEIWTLHGIRQDDSRKKIIWLNSPYFLYVLVAFLIAQTLLPVELRIIKELLGICMILHWLYLGIRILLAPRILPRFEKKIESISKISRQSSIFSILLGSAAWVFSFLVLN